MPDPKLDELTPSHVRNLDVYQPGKPIEELERELGISGAIKVASNENPLGPSPKALAAIPKALSQLHLYPDAGGFALRRALSAKYGVPLEELALGNGSNDLLYQLVLATCEPTDEVLSHKYAFLSYRLSAQVAGRPFVAAPTTPELGLDADALIAAITPRTKVVVLGSPNNPTGSVVTRADAQKVLAALPARALLVIDEAYAEYAAQWPEVDHVDVILTPTTPTAAFPFGAKSTPLDMYMGDVFTLSCNLAGLPGLVVPCGLSEDLPVGAQLLGKPLDEATLLRVGHVIEGFGGLGGKRPLP